MLTKNLVAVLILLVSVYAADADQDDVRVGSTSANLDAVLANNAAWVSSKTSNNTNFFSDHYPSQSPKYLYIGCSDSRVPPNLLMGLDVG